MKIKSVRLSERSRESILKSMSEGFELNYFSGKEYKSKAELSQRITEEHGRVMLDLWYTLYGSLDFSKVPQSLLSGSPFSVGCGNLVEVARLGKKFPGSREGVDAVLDEEDWLATFALLYALKEDLKDFESALKEFSKEVKVILEATNTTKQLVEVWPAAEQYIPASIADPERGINLPMLAISRLDEKLGVQS
jgi:hypothetical protein